MDRSRWAAARLRARGDTLAWTRVTPSGAEVYGGEHTVLKVHREGTRHADLRQRLIGVTDLAAWFLQPVAATLLRAPGERWSTLWPRAQVLDVEDATIPWAEVGALLGGLHHATAAEPRPTLPGAEPLRRLHAALSRLASDHRGGPATPADTRLVQHLGRRLLVQPEQAPADGATVVHGDFHLGQVARSEDGRLVLLDIDDLSVGAAAWDLARPAAFWAAGLLPTGEWEAFRDGYHAAGGPALARDLWGPLDLPARVVTVTAVANALAGARPYSANERLALLEACRAVARSEP